MSHLFACSAVGPSATPLGRAEGLRGDPADWASLLHPLLEIEEDGLRLPLLHAEAVGRDAAGLPLALRLLREGEGWRLEEQSLALQRQHRAGCLMRGPTPLWVQDDQRPLDRRGRPMRSLLQADPSRFTDQAADIVQYLFISEDGQELAQVAQGS